MAVSDIDPSKPSVGVPALERRGLSDNLTRIKIELLDVVSRIGVLEGAGPGAGNMQASTYDPQSISGDAFARANQTGTQAISTIVGLQTALDSKVASIFGLSGVVHFSDLTAQTVTPSLASTIVVRRPDLTYREMPLSLLPGGAVSSVFGETGAVEIASLTEQASPASTAKVAVEQADGSFRSVALSNLPVVAASDSSGATNVKAAPHNATGDGSTDDTAAIQAAIDATASGGVVYLPPGDYSVNKLDVPHNKAMRFEGASPWATTLIGRTAGQDIFRITDPNGATVQNRFQTVHQYVKLGFRLNTGTSGQDLTTGFNRCTAAGLAVGPACIAYVTDHVPSGTGDPGINEAWLHSFGVVQECVVNVSLKHSDHGCAFIYHGANHYGGRTRTSGSRAGTTASPAVCHGAVA